MSLTPHPGPRTVAGVLAVGLLLLGTRWASYLGVAPLFLTDALIACALVHHLLGIPGRSRQADFKPRVGLLLLILTYAVVRLASSTFDLLAVRDAAPYLYAIVGLLGASSVAYADAAARERTAKVILWALGLHAAWSFMVVLFPTLPDRMPMLSAAQQIHIFSTRIDVDTALTGVFAGWLLTLILRRRKVGWLVVAFLACWFMILHTESRAGLLAALVVTGLGFIAGHSSEGALDHRKAIAVMSIPVVLGGVIWSLPQTDIGQRVAGTFGASQSAKAIGANGTANARKNAWRQLIDYTIEDSARYVVGVGFGPDMMGQSGAGMSLIGTNDVGETRPRSPHNYWVGTFGRLGLVGLALAALLGLSVLRRAWQQIRRPVVEDTLGQLVALIGVSLLPVATLGVVLESPFGAVPYFWAAGVLFAYPVRTRSGSPDRRTSRHQGSSVHRYR